MRTYRSYPDALNYEIMKPGSSTKHEEMCGAWIDAGETIQEQVKYWSFYDTDNANAAVRHAESSIYASSRLSSTDMGKFYTSCTQTVLGGTGAIRSSAEAAYNYLKNGMGIVSSQPSMLEAAGWLASHACDGPVLIGTTVDGGSFKARVLRGSTFGAGDLTTSLFALGESMTMQNDAETGNAAINANAMSSPSATIAQLEHVYEGATGRTDHTNVPLIYGITPELDGLIWLGGQGRYSEASAYLHGVAATCAFALHGNLDISSTADYLYHSNRPAAASLGRLKAPAQGEMLTEVTNETVLNASAITWSQIRADPVGNPQTDCVSLARFLFPDRIDAEHFSLMITDDLYNRLYEMSEVIRASVKHVVQNNPPHQRMLHQPSGCGVCYAVDAHPLGRRTTRHMGRHQPRLPRWTAHVFRWSNADGRQASKGDFHRPHQHPLQQRKRVHGTTHLPGHGSERLHLPRGRLHAHDAGGAAQAVCRRALRQCVARQQGGVGHCS